MGEGRRGVFLGVANGFGRTSSTGTRCFGLSLAGENGLLEEEAVSDLTARDLGMIEAGGVDLSCLESFL